MLSDEEKKAIERAEFLIKIDTYLEKEMLTNLLNLIEKQSKEIEELKEKSEYREKIIKGLGLKTLPKTITGFKQLIENNDKKWEDKIKAKIEDILNSENSEAIEKLIEWQSLLEKE